MIKKIVVIGPESTGKSTLCKNLATYFNTSFVEEYAREYLTINGTDYTYEDLLIIAKKQIALEEEALQKLAIDYRRQSTDDPQPPNSKLKTQNHKLLFIDTDMYVMKVWCEFVFDRCHQWVLDTIAERKYDLYLLCNIDLPWVKDALREYPDIDRRQQLYNYYKDALINQSVPWVEINGNHEERFDIALKAVNQLLSITIT